MFFCPAPYLVAFRFAIFHSAKKKLPTCHYKVSSSGSATNKWRDVPWLFCQTRSSANVQIDKSINNYHRTEWKFNSQAQDVHQYLRFCVCCLYYGVDHVNTYELVICPKFPILFKLVIATQKSFLRHPRAVEIIYSIVCHRKFSTLTEIETRWKILQFHRVPPIFLLACVASSCPRHKGLLLRNELSIRILACDVKLSISSCKCTYRAFTSLSPCQDCYLYSSDGGLCSWK